MVLRPYQDVAADFLFERDRAMILAPVGAGKTAITLTAIEAALARGVCTRVLVLAPLRVARDVWPAEVALWAPKLTLAVCTGWPRQRTEALQSSARVVVSNYDNLQWLVEQKLNFDAIVFDELTRLKNPSGQRFKALSKVIEPMSIRWGLTGSFTSNGLEDVFGQCKIVDQTLLGRSKGAFLQSYFHCVNRDYNQWAPYADSLPAVMAKIKPSTFVLDAGDYVDTLPPLHTVEVRCTLHDRKPYDDMKKDFVAQFGNAQIVAVSAAVVTGKLQQMAGGFAYEEGRLPVWFSGHKFERLDELLAENQHANTIIAYGYQAELAALQRRYPHAQTLDDPDAIARWNRGEIELLLAHPKSAGHGLNLQHGGCRVVFLSLPWSLELYEQTIGRLHRSGQRHDVWCYVMLTVDTVDEKIWRALHDKRSVSEVAMEELQ